MSMRGVGAGRPAFAGSSEAGSDDDNDSDYDQEEGWQ
jgi:hypothetical protein